MKLSYRSSMFRIRTLKLSFLVFLVTVSGCVEPFDFETEDFESLLVIEATLTNELKHQEVTLSRAYRFEEDGPLPEENAVVKIIDESNNEYSFEEITPGNYISSQEFSALKGIEYQLIIETSNGSSYISGKEFLPTESGIERVYPVRTFNSENEEGVAILLNSFDPTGNSRYYRYEFEETYRIQAPFWINRDLEAVIVDDELQFEIVERSESERICYNTRQSEQIMITNTSNLVEDRIDGFQLQFIEAEDIRIANRYSILVKQYVHSRETNAYYEILKKFSGSESLFSQAQPGFLQGNITSTTNPDERVVGFFEVASVAEERIFFDREEIIDDLPRFSESCEIIAPAPSPGESTDAFNRRIQAIIGRGNVRLLQVDFDPRPGEGPYSFIERKCADCNVYGDSKRPDFWID